MANIPLVDLEAQYATIRDEINAAIQATLDETDFVMGPRIEAFEREFAEYCGVAHGIAASSGTTALHLALTGCGIAPGDEVITVSHTFIATAEAIVHCGATPVFVDVDPDACTIDPALIEEAITARTRAIIPVHLYGRCADMDPILRIAKKHNLNVIEDAAQAHGAHYKGRRAGSMGDFGCFSFYPGKNLGAYGDAGMVTTSDAKAAGYLSQMANHGRQTKYTHEYIGYNYRMDGIQAAILSVKLKHLEAWTEARRQVARHYDEALKDLPIQLPAPDSGHVYHLYVIQCDKRDQLAEALKREGISTGVHYPVPLHKQPCFSSYPRIELPVTEALADRILSLPMYAELTEADQERVVEAVRRFYQ